MTTIVGPNNGAGDDNLSGTAAADLILGNGGNDNINGNGGQDSLYGGAGADNINFGFGTAPGAPAFDFSSTIIYGGAGADTITSQGSLGFNTIYGGSGNAATDLTDGKNTINLAGDNNADIVFLGGGGDALTLGGGGGSFVTGGAGNDTINGGFGRGVQVNANQGADSIVGSFGGGDLLHGGIGNDTITLNNSGNRFGSIVAADLDNDIINDIGGTASDTLYGGRGNDTITLSGSGNDLVFAGFDSDTVTATGLGVDSIYGGTDTTGQATDGANFLSAVGPNGFDSNPVRRAALLTIADGDFTGTNDAAARVLLVGGGGNDIIIASGNGNVGNAGSTDPSLSARSAIDTLTGGAGSDLFIFGETGGISTGYSNAGATTSATVDAVTDFVSGTDQFRFGNASTTIGGPGYTVGSNSNAQTAANGAPTLIGAASAAIANGGVVAGTGLALNGADIFNFQGTNYLVVNTAGAAGFTTNDYLINVGGLTNVTAKDLNG